MTQPNKNADGQLEGEGSYTGTRKYNKHLAEHQEQHDVAELANEAREALEGEEGEELRRAEQRAKEGPRARPIERHRENGGTAKKS